jgi:hypothetical protein
VYLVVTPLRDHALSVVFQKAQVGSGAGHTAVMLVSLPSHVTLTTTVVLASGYVGHCTCFRSTVPRLHLMVTLTVAE